MAQTSKKWGHGRVKFIADLTSIKDDLSRAIPMTEIFTARKDRLGITYSAFCKLVARYASDARIKPSDPTPTPAAEPKGHAPNVRKSFNDHTGIADPGLLRKLTKG